MFGLYARYYEALADGLAEGDALGGCDGEGLLDGDAEALGELDAFLLGLCCCAGAVELCCWFGWCDALAEVDALADIDVDVLALALVRSVGVAESVLCTLTEEELVGIVSAALAGLPP